MFFSLSKLLWVAITPSNVFFGLILIGALALSTRFRRAGMWSLGAGLALVFSCGVLPIGTLLKLPLENRFAVLSHADARPDAIIVLGGSIDPVTTRERGGQVAVRGAATRLTEAVALARLYPDARIYFTGGSASLIQDDSTPDEARDALTLFKAMGIDPGRVVIERQSRNTHENAANLRGLFRDAPGQRVLLITSAWHMPRAFGIFRAQGYSVVAYPVDFETRNTWRELLRPQGMISQGLESTDRAMREWVGLLVYWLVGKTDALLPGP